MIVADVNNDGHPDIIESAFDMSINGTLVPARSQSIWASPTAASPFRKPTSLTRTEA